MRMAIQHDVGNKHNLVGFMAFIKLYSTTSHPASCITTYSETVTRIESVSIPQGSVMLDSRCHSRCLNLHSGDVRKLALSFLCKRGKSVFNRQHIARDYETGC